MMSNDKPFKALCWLCVGLALSTCTYDACLAQGTGEEVTPDSLGVETGHLQTVEDGLLFDTPADSLGTGDGNIQPLYEKWWVWALVTTAIAVTAVLVGGGKKTVPGEDLPGFPDPPNR